MSHGAKLHNQPNWSLMSSWSSLGRSVGNISLTNETKPICNLFTYFFTSKSHCKDIMEIYNAVENMEYTEDEVSGPYPDWA